MRPVRCAFVVALLTFASSAWAWPVDWVHDVEPGKEKFIRLPSLDWFEIEDPTVVSLEWLPGSEELMVSGLKAGRTQVLLGSQGKVAVWRVRVGDKPLVDDKALKDVVGGCKNVVVTPLEDVKFAATVSSDSCRASLLKLFQSDSFEARALELTFEGTQLQAQLKAFQEVAKDLKVPVAMRFVGAGLVIEGKVTEAQHHKLMWGLFKRAVGRIPLDDKTEVERGETKPR